MSPNEQLIRFLESAMGAAGIAAWEMELPSGILRNCEQKAILLGYDPKQFTHYGHFTEILHPDDYRNVMNAMQLHIDGRTDRYIAEYRIKNIRSEYVWCRDIGGIAIKEKDRILVRGIIMDISDLKKTEIELSENKLIAEENELKYLSLLENSPVGIGIFIGNSPVYANSSLVNLFGYSSKSEFLTSKIGNHIHPEELNEITAIYKSIASGKITIPMAVRFRMINKKGALKHLSVTISKLILHDNTYIQLIFLDNTEFIEMEHSTKKLAMDVFYITEKNKFIHEMNELINELSKKHKFDKRDQDTINTLFKNHLNFDKDWDLMKKHFDVIHNDFFTTLGNKHPKLSQTELRHCAYIKMHLSTNEIARIFNIQPSSIQRARRRLKNKLGLHSEENLHSYISSC
jgi:PAS domain S-box-containing protein